MILNNEKLILLTEDELQFVAGGIKEKSLCEMENTNHLYS